MKEIINKFIERKKNRININKIYEILMFLNHAKILQLIKG